MTRSFLASLGVNVLLLAVVAFCLIQWGGERAKSAELRQELATAGRALSDAAKAIRKHAKTEGENRGVAAQQCATEGSDAFARGRQFGRAEACVLAGY